MTKCLICGEEVLRIRNHLKVHDIDPMDYWVKYVSEDHVYPTCDYCGAPITSFTSNSFNMGPNRYCDKTCKDLDLPRVLVQRHEDGIYEGTSYLINTWNTNIELRLDSLARTSFHRLLRDEDPFSIGFFYVIKIENKSIKFGATRQDLNYYLNFRYHYFDYEVLRKYSSTLLNVATLELWIKTRKRFKELLIEEPYYSPTEELKLEGELELLSFLNRVPFIKEL